MPTVIDTKTRAWPYERRARFEGGDMVIAATELSLERALWVGSREAGYAHFATLGRPIRGARPACAPRTAADGLCRHAPRERSRRLPTDWVGIPRSPTFGWGQAHSVIAPLRPRSTAISGRRSGRARMAGLTSAFRSAGCSGFAPVRARSESNDHRLSAVTCHRVASPGGRRGEFRSQFIAIEI